MLMMLFPKEEELVSILCWFDSVLSELTKKRNWCRVDDDYDDHVVANEK